MKGRACTIHRVFLGMYGQFDTPPVIYMLEAKVQIFIESGPESGLEITLRNVFLASTPGPLTFDIEIEGPGSRLHMTLRPSLINCLFEVL